MTHPLDKLLPALAAAIAAMPDPKKNAKNDHFKNRYADLGAVLECIDQPLRDNGLLLVQTVDSVDGLDLLSTTLWHIESGQSQGSFYPLRPEKPGPQALASCITYARRYAIKAMFGMVDVDDDGERAEDRPKPARQAKPKTTAPPPQNEGPLLLEEALAMVDHAQQIKDLDAIAAKCKHLIGSDRDRLITALREAKTAIDKVPF